MHLGMLHFCVCTYELWQFVIDRNYGLASLCTCCCSFSSYFSTVHRTWPMTVSQKVPTQALSHITLSGEKAVVRKQQQQKQKQQQHQQPLQRVSLLLSSRKGVPMQNTLHGGFSVEKAIPRNHRCVTIKTSTGCIVGSFAM